MKNVLTIGGAGIFVGVVGTILVASLTAQKYTPDAIRGVEMGFGAGFGAVLALLLWNWLTGVSDQVASGKANP